MNGINMLSTLPSIDEMLCRESIKELLVETPRNVVVREIRSAISDLRKRILKLNEEEKENFSINLDKISNQVITRSIKFTNMNLKKVINATGVVLHTNLGRALLSNEIKEEVWDIASSYSTLEMDIATGKRGSRYDHVVELLKFITGAEDALVVNNNAAAVLLTLSTMAKNREVIVSRGELVEIGGSFRIPDVMEQSNAKLVEIGATNKTHLKDYVNAVTDNTAALLKVHTSNYKIVGFTDEVSLKELVKLGREINKPVIEDLGSGVLIDLRKYGITYEPTVQESVQAGVDVITFSGDKLLGASQAGIIVGKKCYIDKMKKNPLTRALRVDKLTMVALEATLRLYLNMDDVVSKIPTLRMITESTKSITRRSEILFGMIKQGSGRLTINMTDDFSRVGGGSLPLEKLPTKVIVISSSNISTTKLEEGLRNYKIPIITRIQGNKIIMDVRTIDEKDYKVICEALDTVAHSIRR
ncbi:MAG: L-seryl-tRNA(Sec) selenium transferase [Alkaliphilus sp.]|nr:L-seryl-tRNA(Sec) selenium transferase [bacterium AH-315-G05]PHS35161.1 MAG: L-seryl-tRNA(Sec) selenium transferase [Alkaliphilus sp.]